MAPPRHTFRNEDEDSPREIVSIRAPAKWTEVAPAIPVFTGANPLLTEQWFQLVENTLPEGSGQNNTEWPLPLLA